MRNAMAVTHVACEDLGSLADVLAESGFAVTTVDAPTLAWDAVDEQQADLWIVLGGPIGVYERQVYPFIDRNVQALARRLAAKRPTLGICLGAQLMAAALGARVYRGHTKELGWAHVDPAADASALPAFAAFLRIDPHVLHWHGDTFDLPAGALHLASTPAFANQAFAVGDQALGLQFHVEVREAALERWYVSHACELSAAGIDVAELRADGQRHACVLEPMAKDLWRAWLAHALRADAARRTCVREDEPAE